jgi:hypothetical protein
VLPRFRLGLQGEDRPPDLLDGAVQLVHVAADPLGQLRPDHLSGHPLQPQPDREQPLDDLVVQVAGDPVAVFEDGQPLPVVLRAGELQGHRGLPGEHGHHQHVGVAERRRVLGLGDPQYAEHVLAGGQRHQRDRPVLELRGKPGLLGGRAVLDDHQRLPGAQHGADQAGVQRDQVAAQRFGAQAGGHLQHQVRPALLDQRQDAQLRVGRGAGALGDQLQRLGRGGAGQQPGGDLGGRGQPARPPAGLLEQPGVLDRDAGRGRQRDHHLLVFLSEVAAAGLLAQVEVAEHLAADPDRNPEEGPHRRVVGRET